MRITNEKRSKIVSFRITPSARKQLERFARARQCSMSDAVEIALIMLQNHTTSDLLRESLRVESSELADRLNQVDSDYQRLQ